MNIFISLLFVFCLQAFAMENQNLNKNESIEAMQTKDNVEDISSAIILKDVPLPPSKSQAKPNISKSKKNIKTQPVEKINLDTKPFKVEPSEVKPVEEKISTVEISNAKLEKPQQTNIDTNSFVAKNNKNQSIYAEETKIIKDYNPRNSRLINSKETDQKPLKHAKTDSDLILNRYENKNFIKQKIQKIARDIAKDGDKKPSIEQQMGLAGQKRISVSIDENVNVRDAIMEVSHLTNVDVEIDPEIEGGVILSLKNAKVSDILTRISELASLNISVKDEVVRFMSDKPFTKNYSISFVDTISSGKNSTIGINNSQGGNRMNGVNGVNNMNMNNGGFGGFNNPWGNNGFNGNSWGGNGFNNNFANNGINNNSLNSLYNSPNSRNGVINNQNTMWEQFEEGLKYIVSQKKGVEYSINKQAGIITLRATLGIHKEVEEYVERIKKLANTQILVEVRLVQVELEDEFTSGIDFNYAKGKISATQSFIPGSISNAANSSFVGKFADKSKGLAGAIQFLQIFGTTKTISSPRLNVMNNQRAQLSFAKDYVYFYIQPQMQNQFIAAGTPITNPQTPIIVQSVMQTVPIGVILDLQATADIESQEITMSIHPTISAVTGEKEDPAASFLSNLQLSGFSSQGKVTNSIPIVEKKELDSTLRIKSGDIMVIGGFNEEKTVVVRKGIPVLKDTPVIKYLFGSDQKAVKNVETVIFIKASIVGSENPISDQDVKFYNDFS